MQRDRQRHMRGIVDQPIDLRNDPAGRKRDVPRADIRSLLARHTAQKRHHVVIVIQRFAAAHQDDIRDRAGFALLRRFIALNFGKEGQHFTRSKRTDTALQCACAEPAAHIAADLRREADRIAIGIAHQNAFDKVSVLQRKQILDRSVLRRNPFIIDCRAAERDRAELCAKILRKIRHLLRTNTLMKPFPYLCNPEFRHIEAADGVGDLGIGHVHPVHRLSSLTVLRSRIRPCRRA